MVRITLLISTYNWPEALLLTLKSVARQRVLPDEVVIADDGSTDETRKVIEKFRNEVRFPVKHVWHEDEGFRLAAIRNKAIVASEGDFIIQIDGDIILHPYFIADYARRIRPGYFLTGFRSRIKTERTQSLLAEESIGLSHIWRELTKKKHSLRFPWISRLTSLYRSQALSRVMGTNMGYWRKDVMRINGYDESFEGWGGKDTNLTARLMHSGIKRRSMLFSAVIYHLHHPERKNPISAPRNYKKNLEVFRKKETICRNGIEKLD